jgi:hypothetical protein
MSFDGFNLNTSYPKEQSMKRAMLILSLLLAGTASAQVNNWENSPNNWNNSQNNWSNSPNNWQNSPNNWNNSANNWNATNGVYNNQGNRIGYETQSPSGVTNVFDNNGNRIGYTPAK